MLYEDLRELKSLFEIDPENTAEDKALLIYNQWMTSVVEEVCGRKFTYGLYTEYYKGTGSLKLVLKKRPVYVSPSPPLVYIDQGGFFGSASGAFTGQNTQLFYGSDFCMDIDQDDNTSRSGILYRIGDFWQKIPYRQEGYLFPFVGPDLGSYKIVYYGGFTVSQLPGAFRLACAELVAGIRYLFPTGLPTTAENYEDRAISLSPSQYDYLLSLARPRLSTYRNWYF